MVRQEKQAKFSVGDRVTTQSGEDRKGTVTRLGKYDGVQVKWDGGQQQLMLVSDLKKEERESYRKWK